MGNITRLVWMEKNVCCGKERITLTNKNQNYKQMKHLTKIVLWTCLITIMNSGCSTSSIAVKEKEISLRKAIESRAFTVNVNRINPTGAPSRQLTSDYSLTVKERKVDSYLPYFGRAYSVPYGGGKGLNFNAEISDYKLSFDDKGKALIEFRTKNDEDQYVYRLEIFPNGSTTINVTPVNRQAVSFYGTAEPLEQGK